jgi:16S rRNA (cytosine967-C5)-methyltransferase
MTKTKPQHANPRLIALQILQSVLDQGRPLDEALSAHAGLGRLEARDRGFVRNLVATTLRRLGQIDALIDHCLDRPLKPKLAELRQVLRLGACQLAFLTAAWSTPCCAA